MEENPKTQINPVVVFLTQNQKLIGNLQATLKNTEVIKVENIDGINNALKKHTVKAVVLHIINSAGWIIFEFLKTGYPEIPRYVILAPSLSRDEDFDPETLAKKYGAAAITSEKYGIKPLGNIIALDLAGKREQTSKESYLEIFGDVARELERLQHEFTIIGMRTLPQPEIGDDTTKKLYLVLTKLQGIKIKP